MMKQQNAGPPTQEDRKLEEADCTGDGPFAVIPSGLRGVCAADSVLREARKAMRAASGFLWGLG